MSPEPARWTAAWQVVGFGGCILAIGVLLSLPVLLLRQLTDFPWLEGLSWWKIFRRCVSIAAALTLWFFMRKVTRRTVRSYGLSAPGVGKRQLQFGVLLGLGVLALMLGVFVLSGACRIDVTSNTFKLWRVVLTFLPAVLVIGVLEELVFRGFILQHLLPFSKVGAVIASSVLYALVHLRAPSWTAASMEMVGLFLLGSVLALSVLLTQQLYLAVGLHAALAYGARVNKLFIDFPDGSLAWLVGTSRLTDGLINWVVLVGLGAVITWWARASSHALRRAASGSPCNGSEV